MVYALKLLDGVKNLKSQAFRIEHPEISGLTEGACKPLMRETSPGIIAKAIETTGRQLTAINVPKGTLSERAARHVIKEKDTAVKAKVIEKLGKC